MQINYNVLQSTVQCNLLQNLYEVRLSVRRILLYSKCTRWWCILCSKCLVGAPNSRSNNFHVKTTTVSSVGTKIQVWIPLPTVKQNLDLVVNNGLKHFFSQCCFKKRQFCNAIGIFYWFSLKRLYSCLILKKAKRSDWCSLCNKSYLKLYKKSYFHIKVKNPKKCRSPERRTEFSRLPLFCLLKFNNCFRQTQILVELKTQSQSATILEFFDL